jgi:rRNA maturation endonuclease Nob1
MIKIVNTNDDKILIFDTNIFLTGINFNVITGKIFTVPEVIDEIRVERYIEKNRNILNRINYARERKKLILREPNEEYINKVRKRAKITHDLRVLSKVDIKLIALALELQSNTEKNVILYTNDYSMENLCSELNIPFSPLRKKGIKKLRKYELYCPFCNEFKHTDQEFCEKCGSKLKRRRVKTQKYNSDK